MLRKKWVLGAGVIAVIGACAVQQDVQQEEGGMPVPSSQLARSSGVPIGNLGEGYSLYQIHCSQCHIQKLPKDMQVETWHAIVPGMAWNTGLKPEDEKAIMVYLAAITKQAIPQ